MPRVMRCSQATARFQHIHVHSTSKRARRLRPVLPRIASTANKRQRVSRSAARPSYGASPGIFCRHGGTDISPFPTRLMRGITMSWVRVTTAKYTTALLFYVLAQQKLHTAVMKGLWPLNACRPSCVFNPDRYVLLETASAHVLQAQQQQPSR